MVKVGRRALFVAILFALPITATAQSRTWEYAGHGEWPQIASSGTSQPTTRAANVPELDRIAEMVKEGSNKAAEKRAVAWLKANKSHPQRDRAIFLNAQALYQYGNRIRAFYYCDELLDEYPDSELYYP